MAAAGHDRSADPAYEPVIGLEVHVQLRTRTKMFCRCECRFGAEPNSLTCPVCVGLPGALPSINRKAVEYAVRVALAFGCEIPRFTKFDRKNYYYPDLPKGYQISQFDLPIGSGGRVEYSLGDERRSVRLVRAHLEEDAGKSIHVEGEPESWVDLNRAGTPLLEIVTEPDIHSLEEAGAFLRMMRLVLLHLGVSDCNMEEGSLRCDCNVSVRPRGSSHLETRTELKNLNSFTFIENALRHEISRQIRVRESGGSVVQETRLYDPDADETRGMRGKEEAHDYRYFPEPDLAPLELSDERVEELRRNLPELPLARRERLRSSLGLSDYLADVLVQNKEIADFFQRCVDLYEQPKSLANWVVNSLQEELNSRKVSVDGLGLSPQRFVDLVQAVDSGVVSTRKARDLLRAMLENDKPVAALIEELGLEQISDDSLILDLVKQVIADHPGPVGDVRGGKKNSINFLVGQVMRQTKGKANPGRAAQLLREQIGE